MKKRVQPLDGEAQAAGRARFVRQDSDKVWDKGECTHLSSFGRTGRQDGGWGIYPGEVGGAGSPVKWPRGDLKCIWGPPQKSLGKCGEAEILTID